LASQLRFEGAELDDVLARVRTEVGPDARIIGANKIRKGGIGGFFAKEGYEVVVDLPEGAQASRRAPRPRPAVADATSVLDLADEVSSQEREQVIDLSDAPLSTERHDFGAMLSRLSRELEDEEARQQARSERPVSPTKHYRRVTAEPAEPAPTATAAAAAPTAAPSAPATTPTPAPAPPMPAAMPAPMPFALPEAAPGSDPRLLALGLPPELAPSTAARNDLRTALVQRLAQLPAPPMLPRTNGVLIAIVGIGTAPIALARRLADELDVDTDHLVLATPEAMSDVSHPEEAEAFRRSCRRRSEPTIIACSIGPGRAQLGWAHRILDKLEPTITWAVVEASCKPEDIDHRISLLGGADVLAITGIADTVSPAAILGINVPVGRIGSNPATPAVWADLLMERLER
jgi:hypothetical protein